MLLTVGEVADRMRVSRRTVLRLIHSDKLPAINISSGSQPRFRIDDEELAAFISGQSFQATRRRIRRDYNRVV